MVVINNNIVVDSTYIRDVILNPGDYSSIEIEVTRDCGTIPVKYFLPIAASQFWYIDFTRAVALENFVTRLNIVSLISYHPVNALSNSIDLGYVEDNCANVVPCTLEIYSGIFIPLFKNQIDAYFQSVGITSNVSIAFVGNLIKIGNFPLGFIPESAEYGPDAPYTKIAASYGLPTSKVYLSDSALYFTPEFFGLSNFTDGIFKFKLKYVKINSSGYIIEENCFFLDVYTKCKLANLLQGLSKESTDQSPKSQSTVAHLMHYALVNASNCGCACDEMCTLYKELQNILDGLDPQTLDCGC